MCNSQIKATVMNMTEQEFTEKVGSAPIQDDLERVNCPIVGKMKEAHEHLVKARMLFGELSALDNNTKCIEQLNKEISEK